MDYFGELAAAQLGTSAWNMQDEYTDTFFKFSFGWIFRMFSSDLVLFEGV